MQLPTDQILTGTYYIEKTLLKFEFCRETQETRDRIDQNDGQRDPWSIHALPGR